MSGTLGICPVCSREIAGGPKQLEGHVNKHLDDGEEDLSRKVAEELSAGIVRTENRSENDFANLTPAERMMKEVEDNDAALASALEAAELGDNGYIGPSLRVALSDSAEHFLPNIMQTILPPFDVVETVLCREIHIASKLDLFSSNIAGLGWDCGFRNIQMLCSSLLHSQRHKQVLSQSGITEVPSVPEIAGRIEDAWRKGFDPEGRAEFDGKLIDKEVWIGATEVYILLRNLNLPAFVKDFETPDDHFKRQMFEWIFSHFKYWCNGKSCPLHKRGFRSGRHPSFVPPLFCQWSGHSVTIVGAEKSRNGEITLLVLDPMRGFYQSILGSRSSRTNVSLVRRGLDHPQLAHPRFQFVSIPLQQVANEENEAPPARRTRRGPLQRLRSRTSRA